MVIDNNAAIPIQNSKGDSGGAEQVFENGQASQLPDLIGEYDQLSLVVNSLTNVHYTRKNLMVALAAPPPRFPELAAFIHGH